MTQNFTDTVSIVEFFAGTNNLGTTSNSTPVWIGDDSESPDHHSFSLIWSNAAVGDYSLTARATDAAGITVTSAPVSISVVTDLPPVVTLVKPRDNAIILGPTNVASSWPPPLTRMAPCPMCTSLPMAAFLGTVTNPPVTWVTNSHGVFPIYHTAYSLTWSNNAPGSFTLTAVATDNSGVMSTSSPVHVSIVTNLPPIVQDFTAG